MSDTPIIKLNKAIIRQSDNIILKDVDLEIEKGEFVYLIGRVGSGKSSLLKTLYSDLPLTDGSGTVVGYNLPSIKNKQVPFLRRKIGIVFQDFQLLTDRNIEDNLHFVLKATGWKNTNDIKSRISEVLEKVKMNNKGYKMPHELSGGEQQRIVIARALLNSPDIILADEPTGNLDPETSDELLRLLQDISKSGKTIVMATHQHDLLSKFPARVIECKDGQVIEVSKNTSETVIDFTESESIE